MLSHHELAALLVVRDAQAPIQTLDSNFLALQRYQLVEMEDNGDAAALRLTTRGQELLRLLRLDNASD